MFALARHHLRLTALTSSAIAAAALSGFIDLPSRGEAPASPKPLAVAARLSPSGKIADRLPDGGPTAPRFTAQVFPWPTRIAAPAANALEIPAIVDGLALAEAASVQKPALASDAKPHLPPGSKPARVAAHEVKTPVAIAALPPPRPTSLRAPHNTAEVASVERKHTSVAARMIVFVGSLASLARPL